MSLSQSVRAVANKSGISERTLWNYVAGKIPEKIPKLTDLCGVLECHPAELLTPYWRDVYEGLLIDVDALVFDDDTDFLEKSPELRGWSRELREWEKFFETGVFDDEADTAGQTKSDLFKPIKRP